MSLIEHCGRLDRALTQRNIECERLQTQVLALENDGMELAAKLGEAEHQLAGAVDLLATFVDDEPCRLDHHGYCQTHGWLQEGECNVARARRLIGGQ